MSHQVCHDVGEWVSSRAACSPYIAQTASCHMASEEPH
jgi:hypothetical protein